MKKLSFLLAISLIFLCANTITSNAQIAASGHQNTLPRQTTTLNNNGTIVLAGFDTLNSLAGTSDTGYIQWNNPGNYFQVIDLFVRYISVTLAGTAVLQGSNASTMPGVRATTWQTLIGVQTYQAGGIGAAATLTGTGTTQYTWHLPQAGSDYQQYQLRIIATASCTATYTSRVTYKN